MSNRAEGKSKQIATPAMKRGRPTNVERKTRDRSGSMSDVLNTMERYGDKVKRKQGWDQYGERVERK